MRYIVKLTYVRRPEIVNAHLDIHQDWLVEHIRLRRIIAAGPLEDHMGGSFSPTVRNVELKHMLGQDSFHAYEVATYGLTGLTAVM